MENLTLKNVKVIFADLEDRGYGRSITIDVTEPEVADIVKDWCKATGVNGGKANIKEYTNKETGEKTLQYNFKLSKFTEIEYKEGIAERLGWGSVINLTARAYEYDNKIGKGIGASLAAVFVVEPAVSSKMDAIRE